MMNYVLFIVMMVLVIVVTQWDVGINNIPKVVNKHYNSRKYKLSKVMLICMGWFYGAIIVRVILAVIAVLLYIRTVEAIIPDVKEVIIYGLLGYHTMAIAMRINSFHKAYYLRTVATYEYHYEMFYGSRYTEVNKLDMVRKDINTRFHDTMANIEKLNVTMNHQVEKDIDSVIHFVVSIIVLIASFF